MLVKKFRRKVRFLLQFGWDFVFLSLRLLWKRPSASILLCIGSPGSVGGTEFLVNKIAELLSERKEKVLVLTTGKLSDKRTHLFLKRLQSQKIPHIPIGSLSSGPKSCLAFLLRRFRASHCHFFNPPATSLIPAAKKAGMKIFYIETGLPKPNDRWWQPLFAHISHIDKVFAVSHASLHHFQSLFSYPGPTAIFYPLIDAPPPHLSERSLPSSGSRDLHVVYFGRIYRDKGVKELLEAFRLFLHTFPSAHLTYIGEGPDKNFLQKQVASYGMEGNVHFCGFEKREHLWEKLYTFDLFCLPSLSEGAPCSILEAMSIGLPVVAARIGGIPEMIEHEVSGLLVEPNNSQALFQALCLCAQNPSFRKNLGIQGQKRYRDFTETPFRAIL